MALAEHVNVTRRFQRAIRIDLDLGDPGANQLLRAPVGFGDRRAVALQFRLYAEAEELERQLAGDPGGLDRKVEFGLIVGGHVVAP